MKWFLVLTLSLLTGCASFPQWSENPQKTVVDGTKGFLKIYIQVLRNNCQENTFV